MNTTPHEEVVEKVFIQKKGGDTGRKTFESNKALEEEEENPIKTKMETKQAYPPEKTGPTLFKTLHQPEKWSVIALKTKSCK